MILKIYHPGLFILSDIRTNTDGRYILEVWLFLKLYAYTESLIIKRSGEGIHTYFGLLFFFLHSHFTVRCVGRAGFLCCQGNKRDWHNHSNSLRHACDIRRNVH